MLDMGFIHDVKKLVAMMPSGRKQTLLFSATMPPDIARFARPRSCAIRCGSR